MRREAGSAMDGLASNDARRVYEMAKRVEAVCCPLLLLVLSFPEF